MRDFIPAPTHFLIPPNDERSEESVESKTLTGDLNPEGERSELLVVHNLPNSLLFDAIDDRREERRRRR